MSIYQLRKKLINGQVNDIITIQGNAWWKPEIEKSPDIGYPPFRQNPEFEPIYFNGAYFRQININIGDTQDLSYFYERDGYLPDSRMIFMYPYALYSIWDDSPEQQLKYNDLKEGLGLL